VSFHFYADDTQIYFPLKHNDKQGLETLLACLIDVRSWMSLNFLHLNKSETEAIVFGPSVGKATLNTNYDYFKLLYQTHCEKSRSSFWSICQVWPTCKVLFFPS